MPGMLKIDEIPCAYDDAPLIAFSCSHFIDAGLSWVDDSTFSSCESDLDGRPGHRPSGVT
jgi:hypothetical protein